MSARTDAIADAITDALMYFFEQKLAPSRKIIANWIKDRKPELDADGRLDPTVAKGLNGLVEAGMLWMVEGNLYVPNEKHYKPTGVEKKECIDKND